MQNAHGARGICGGRNGLQHPVECPFGDPEEAFDFSPEEVYGLPDEKQLTAQFNEDYRRKMEATPDAVNTTGVYITMISGLLEIFGWDILLMAMGIDAKAFGETANRYGTWIQHYFNALARCDAPVVKVHDDITWTSGAFARPDWYREFIFPNYKRLFAPLREAGKKIIFTSDGNYTEFIDDIADCGVSGFVMEPSTDMKYVAEKYGKTHSFIGNADTRILLSGSREEIYSEVKRCMDIGKACPGFIMQWETTSRLIHRSKTVCIIMKYLKSSDGVRFSRGGSCPLRPAVPKSLAGGDGNHRNV